MPRVFVAIPLSDEAKQSLLAIQPSRRRGLRIVGRDELHLTLHFLGDVQEDQVDMICKSLGETRCQRFLFAIQSVGQFPPRGPARVLWAGVVNDPTLLELHANLGKALQEAIGYQPESRPYSPHVTLARVNAPIPASIVRQFLDDHRDYRAPTFQAERFVLYASHLNDEGPRYVELAEFPLSNGVSAS